MSEDRKSAKDLFPPTQCVHGNTLNSLTGCAKCKETLERYKVTSFNVRDSDCKIPYSIEVDPVLKLRVETALTIIKQYGSKALPEFVLVNSVKSVNPELTAYLNACDFLAQYLDSKTPQIYTIK